MRPALSIVRTIELRLLDCLVALVEESSVTNAARRCDMSQPRMSNALARLRELTGDPLLVRAGQRMVATSRAIDIAASVNLGLQRIDAALAALEAFKPQTSTRRFVVAMSEYVSLAVLPSLLGRIDRLAPYLEIAVKTLDPIAIRRWLEDGSVTWPLVCSSAWRNNFERLFSCTTMQPASQG